MSKVRYQIKHLCCKKTHLSKSLLQCRDPQKSSSPAMWQLFPRTTSASMSRRVCHRLPSLPQPDQKKTLDLEDSTLLNSWAFQTNHFQRAFEISGFCWVWLSELSASEKIAFWWTSICSFHCSDARMQLPIQIGTKGHGTPIKKARKTNVYPRKFSRIPGSFSFTRWFSVATLCDLLKSFESFTSLKSAHPTEPETSFVNDFHTNCQSPASRGQCFEGCSLYLPPPRLRRLGFSASPAHRRPAAAHPWRATSGRPHARPEASTRWVPAKRRKKTRRENEAEKVQ